MKIIKFLELDEKAQILEEKDLKSNFKKETELGSINYPQKKEKDYKISGEWLLIDELIEIKNQYLVYQKDEENKNTWIRLPDKFVTEDYMVNYSPEDQCPLGIDALIKEDGYPIGVIQGCDSIKQAKVDNNLDGHRYKGELGITLNSQYFLTYKKDNQEFKVVKTNVDWDRGKHTI